MDSSNLVNVFFSGPSDYISDANFVKSRDGRAEVFKRGSVQVFLI